MKITLDSGALEKLIGGNTEVEVELRNCIVQEFTKKYLKDIVNSELVRNAKNEITKNLENIKVEVNKEINKELDTKFTYAKESYYSAGKRVLTDEYKELIKKQIHSAFYDLFEENYKGEWQKCKDRIDDYIKSKEPGLKEYFDKLTKTYIDNEVRKKFESALAGVK